MYFGVLTESLVKKRSKHSSADVKNLDVWGHKLTNISLVEKMTKLEIASFSLNKISTLKHFKACKNLRCLFLRGNLISDFNEIKFLAELPNLRTLWLDNNPIASEPDYREKIMQMLPKLTKLDEVEITEFERIEAPKQQNKRSPRLIAVTQSFPELAANEPQPPKAKTAPVKAPEKKSPRPPVPESAAPGSTAAEKNEPKKTETKPERKHRANDKPLLNAVLELLPELSPESLDIILRNAQDLKK